MASTVMQEQQPAAAVPDERQSTAPGDATAAGSLPHVPLVGKPLGQLPGEPVGPSISSPTPTVGIGAAQSQPMPVPGHMGTCIGCVQAHASVLPRGADQWCPTRRLSLTTCIPAPRVPQSAWVHGLRRAFPGRAHGSKHAGRQPLDVGASRCVSSRDGRSDVADGAHGDDGRRRLCRCATRFDPGAAFLPVIRSSPLDSRCICDAPCSRPASLSRASIQARVWHSTGLCRLPPSL